MSISVDTIYKSLKMEVIGSLLPHLLQYTVKYPYSLTVGAKGVLCPIKRQINRLIISIRCPFLRTHYKPLLDTLEDG